MDEGDETLDDILGQTGWIRGLARSLVMDAAARDDVVQQVWVEALRKGRRARALRPWLFGVMRNVARKEFRRDASRRAREEASAPATAAPQPDELVERVELEREVASALLEIAEPYRSTLLLRYYEDLAPTEIARRLKIPPGTVRWRLKEGLELLRANLDARFSGDRRRWAIALVPTAAAARSGLGKVAIATIGGALIMKVSTKIIAAAVVLLLFIVGGVAIFRHAATTNEVSRAHPGVAWRVPGGIGATATAPPTVAGVAVPSWFGQRGAPLRRIAGRVTFGGAPVPNATVELQSELTDAGMLRPAKRRTGSDGLFDFGTQPPAKFSVAATADERSPAIVEIDTRDPTSAAERLELRLGGCQSQLLGHVSDSSGGPIAGAKVCLAPPRASACVETDSSGAYKACLSPHQNLVAVAATGYGAIYDRFEYTGRRVQRDYKLTPEATIVGRVIRADTNAPVAGASVRSSSTEAGLRFAAPGATTTDDAGRFTLSGLAGGRHRVLAFAEGVASAEAVEVNVEPGRSSGEVLLRLVQASRLSGVVTDGRDPIVGATVSLGFGESRGSVDAVTQPDGSFVIDPVARGVAMLTVRDYDVREPKTIKIDRANVSGVHVIVDAMASVAGHVTFQGKPFAGAEAGDGFQLNAPTDSDGNYVLRGMPPGRYHMSAMDPTTRAFGWGPELVLAKGEKRTGIDIDIDRTAKISGVVVESDGTPVSAVMVSVEMVGVTDFGQDVTSPDGTFCIRYIMGGGDYRASVLASAQFTTVHLKLASDSATTINVKDGTTEVTGVRLVVQRDHLSISGRTVDSDGQPFSDVRVVAFRADDMTGSMLDDWYSHPSAISATDGSWSIADLDSATYTLRARAGDGSEGLVRGVSAGQKNVVVTLQGTGAIDGTLVGFSSPPSVHAIRRLGMSVTNVYATVQGNSFHIVGLSPGSYQVAAIGAEEDARSVEVVAGQTATVALQSRGSTTVRGHLVDWASGSAVPGLRCTAALRPSPSVLVPLNAIVGLTDDSGAFVLEGVPTGDISVLCFPATPYWTFGRTDLTVTSGQDATCQVQAVKRDPNVPQAEIGAVIDPIAMPLQFQLIAPNGPAQRAGIHPGDVLIAIDGLNASQLSPFGATVAISQRPAGSTAHLGLARGAQTITADVAIQ